VGEKILIEVASRAISIGGFTPIQILIFGVILLLLLLLIAWFYNRVFPSKTGPDDLIGMKGKACDNLAPYGMVSVNGEIWNARTEGGIIEKGEEIKVEAVEDGMVLKVKKG
jgi:membrane protein implicated in regulation of membrane protease activity